MHTVFEVTYREIETSKNVNNFIRTLFEGSHDYDEIVGYWEGDKARMLEAVNTCLPPVDEYDLDFNEGYAKLEIEILTWINEFYKGCEDEEVKTIHIQEPTWE